MKEPNINPQDFLFTNFVTGIKKVPYNTTTLLVNNYPQKTIDLVYQIGEEKTQKSIMKDKIKDISYVNKIRVSTETKKIEENSTKSALLSAVVFGGNPIMQMAGTYGINYLFDAMSNNYEKVKLNTEFEITIKYLEKNEEKKLILISNSNPIELINRINNKDINSIKTIDKKIDDLPLNTENKVNGSLSKLFQISLSVEFFISIFAFIGVPLSFNGQSLEPVYGYGVVILFSPILAVVAIYQIMYIMINYKKLSGDSKSTIKLVIIAFLAAIFISDLIRT